ncbi:hypothetical protein BWZ20_01045 [Winogradskyella sp. J14-2]|uniref:hypothetical protein n=1 Tax=Winogradskyella sp. J14-2 TaxID=1936080 RepID=UPI0009727776|nr:hypothetical protein [Winogradskyella sp. J14-2]APY06967.1 hypothetical protein BWZ20_01045 [Winogradskyella sp. J14-2]
MMRHLYVIFALLLLTACDDGDIITVDLEFDKELDLCTNNTESFLIYDTRENPNESLSLIIPRGNNEEFPFTEATPVGEPIEFNLQQIGNRFIYRTYNRSIVDGELCSPIPPANLTIVEDYEADAGTAFATVSIEDDDNDGIPNTFEYGPGGIDNPRNSDDDEFPDYIDQDDDNDNVLTINEIETDDIDGDGDPSNNLDTDGDGIADYLDEDDDGDGVDTILEDANQNKDPRDDRNLNAEGVEVPDYLNVLEATDHGNPGLAGGNIYTRTVTVNFLIEDFNLDILSATEIDFGTLTYDITFIEEADD